MSPIEKIVKWVKDQPEWWQHSVRLSLKEGSLSSRGLAEVYKLALVEHEIVYDDDFSKLVAAPIETAGFAEETNKVTLNKIESVVNVGALADDQTLSFSENGLTVIYGDNGSGKSSYARILKHACLSRGAPPIILGNIFEDDDSPSSAKIHVNSDGGVILNDWGLEFVGDSSLKSIRVFDSDAAEHFVAKEDELGYKPSGLHVLEDLAESIEYVGRQVTKEIMPGNGFVLLPEFHDTKTGKFVNSISHDTDIVEIESFIASDEEVDRIEPLKKEINALKLKSPLQVRKEISGQIRQISPLKDFFAKSAAVISDPVFDDLKKKEADCLAKKEFAIDLRKKVLSGLPIEGVGGESWQLMWDSAKRYFESMEPPMTFPPAEEEFCPLCLQEISSLSSKRMAGFVEFMMSDAVKLANDANNILDSEKNKIRRYNFDLTAYDAAISLAEEFIEGFRVDITSIFAIFVSRQSYFSGDLLPEKKLDSLDLGVLRKIEELLERLDRSLSSIPEDGDSEALIVVKEAECLELVDKKIFRESVDSIRKNIERHKIVKKYENLQGQCNSRAVTGKNTEICREEVVSPLVEAFNAELGKFGFSRFRVLPKTRGKSGSQLLKLAILDGSEPLVSKVASEGEQRCISIACFLAEMIADKRGSAVIFDDPVNSLSHQWSYRVAKRLVEESLCRQVIVLTHDIVFYKMLLEETEGTSGAQVSEVCLERNRRRAGIVRENPPWDALTTGKRIKKLQSMLRDLRDIDQAGTEREFRESAYIFYGYLREAWERLVEEKLLNQVVTRFGRAVQTNRLKRLVDDINQSDFDRIEKGMTRCSAFFRGHDSAPSVGDAFVTVQDIEDDLKLISDFNDELQKSRKRN